MNRLCRIDEASGSQAAYERRATDPDQRGEAAGDYEFMIRPCAWA
jgi:hypothetical protein